MAAIGTAVMLFLLFYSWKYTKRLVEPEYYLDMLNMSLDTLRQKYLTATEPSDIIFYGYLYQEKNASD